MVTLTPMMQQYKDIKNQYPDSVLFFRLGDFYEMFFEDAQLASRVLEITLTSRDGGGQRVPMCGVPHHSVDAYIAKMITNGYKVAVCDQVEDARASKGIVKREVTRIITPGTIIEGQMLDDKNNNYICSIYVEKYIWGLAFADISTGEFKVTEINDDNAMGILLNELGRINPSELLLPTDIDDSEIILKEINRICSPVISYYPDVVNNRSVLIDCIYSQFPSENIEDTAVNINSPCFTAAGVLVKFLQDTQKRGLNHIRELKHYLINKYLTLDASARRNLELLKTIIDGGKKGSLLWVLDHTQTSMGGRLLKKWVEQPLINIERINARLDAVEELSADIFLREDLRQALKQIYDLERITTKVVYGTANARDLLALKGSLNILPHIKEILMGAKSILLNQTIEKLDTLAGLVDLLDRGLAEDPPVSIRDGNIIKLGYDQEVDKLREASTNGRNWLTQLELAERQSTGIKSLKIGFNKVFGYYIEVTKSNLSAVPEYYQRRQTLANAERYITPELKKYEEMILGAQDKLIELEYNLFIQMRDEVLKHVSRIQNSAKSVAKIDVILSLAESAVKNRYIRPVLNDDNIINIIDGRHPVVEISLGSGSFVPNDTFLDCQSHYISLITGPNMGGKSTYQRQVATIVLMAQMGSFVPASYAEIGIVDCIFARVGASDDLASGHSTFMMEMFECNNALRLATQKSLVIIDELGRGTSNLEGMAIAQSVIEYLHNHVGCRTLFSTHYHELAEMDAYLPGIKNYAAAVEEKGNNVAFLHRIIPGKASKSYGVHCAKLAGLPGSVIERANKLVIELEVYRQAAEEVISGKQQIAITNQVKLMEDKIIDSKIEALIEEITNIDLLNTTPLEAINTLYKLRDKVEKIIKT